MKAVAVLALVVAAVFLSLFLSAVTVGAVGAVFLNVPFSYGYHRGWARWGWLIVFWLFVFGSHARSGSK